MYWFVFCKTDLLLLKTADGFTIPRGEACPIEVKPWNIVHNIDPMADGEEVRTVMIDSPITGRDDMEMCPLRQSYYKLDKALYLKAGKCQEILYWDHNTKFCGVCGGMMKKHTDISKRCTECGKEVWPQVAVAVIVLIRREDKILLVRAKNFRRYYFGLVAGFVETGETLEEAVEREVAEEVGMKIKNLEYISSQPWPYPSGLMVGYMADWAEGELKLQRSELEEGGWFDKDHLPEIPEKLSIARQLIDRWSSPTSKEGESGDTDNNN